MKQKRNFKKLSLIKTTITNLEPGLMKNARGGVTETVCINSNTPCWTDTTPDVTLHGAGCETAYSKTSCVDTATQTSINPGPTLN